MHRQTGLERMLLHARGHTPIVCAAGMHYDRRSAKNVPSEYVKYRHHVLRKHISCKLWTFLHLYHHFCVDMHSSVCYSGITKEKGGDTNEVTALSISLSFPTDLHHASFDHPVVNLILILSMLCSIAFAGTVVKYRTCESCSQAGNGRMLCENDTHKTSTSMQHTAADGSICNYYHLRSHHEWDCPNCNNSPTLGEHNCVEIHQCQFGARVICPY